MEEKLTEKQQKILDLINREVKDKGYPPSVREICKELGFKSTSTAHAYLKKLQEMGYLKKSPSTPRGLKILDKGAANNKRSVTHTVDVPIIGSVTAGEPILAVENIEDYFPVPEEYAKSSTVFMLKVSGESMIEAGILDGDMVMVKKQSTAANGEKVVALLDDEATVKTFYKEKDHIRLQPENKYMSPIIVDNTESFSILGKVIGLFRTMK